MVRVLGGLIFGALMLSFLAACTEAPQEVQLESLQDRVGYGIGLRIGRDFRTQGVAIDPKVLLKGVEDGLSGAAPLLSDEEIQKALTAMQAELNQRQEKRRKALGEESLRAGQVFLERNGKKEGVVTLPSGLQYQVLRQGEGVIPGQNDRVTVHYRGRLIDGTEFDSSYARSKPATFPVAGVISGWSEALQRMPVGSQWRIFLPPDLAYGSQGAGSMIGPNAVLIFDIELLGTGE
jgi:FKBP-type peptidyl-prolyl cis-trans isomerase FklB